MQCTGLKDRKGTEIYEGDLLREQHGRGQTIYEVKIGEASLRVDGRTRIYQGVYIVERSTTSSFSQMDDLSPLDWPGMGSLEIIGNIYETPQAEQALMLPC